MGNGDEKLKLELIVDKGNSGKVLNDTSVQIQATAKYQKTLNEMLKKGAVDQITYSQETTRNKLKLQELNKTQKQTTNVITASSGSIKELSNQLNLNRANYDALSKEQRENEEVGGKLLKTIDEQAKSLKELRAETGRNQDNVGNYKDDVKAALAEQDLFSQGLDVTSVSTGGVFKSIKSLLPMLSSLRGALIATGVGALVIGVMALVQYFTKTEEGAGKLRIIMSVLGTITGELVDLVIGLGENIFKAFSNPVETVKNLGNSIKTFVMDKVNSLMSGLGHLGTAFSKLMKGDFSGALAEGKKGIKDLFDASPVSNFFNVAKAGYDAINKKIKEGYADTKKAIDLQKLENQLIKDKRGFLVEEAQLNVAKNEALNIAADQTKTSLEKQEALNIAEEANTALFNKRIAIAQTEYNIQKERNNLSASSEEDLEKEAELQASLIQLQADRAAAEKEILGQKTGLIKAENDKIVASEATRIEKEEELTTARTEREKTFKEEAKTLEEEEYLLSLETDEERYQYQQEIKKARDLADIEQSKYNDEQKAILKAKIAKKYDAETLAHNKATTTKQQEIDDVATQSKMDNTSKSFGMLASAGNEGTIANKAGAIGESTINAHQAITSVLKDASVPAWLKIPMAAMIGGKAMMSVGKIAGISVKKRKTSLPKAEKGGWIGGNYHHSGGTILEAERDEFIVNRKTMSNPEMANTIQELNDAGNEGRAANVGVTEERVAQIAAEVVKAIPVYVSEQDITDTQRKVITRENKFNY